MNLIDIHAHLESEKFSKDLPKVIENAKKNNIKLIINSGVNPSTNRKALEVSKKYSPIVKVSFGIYPVDAIANQIENPTDDFVRFVEKFDVDKELKWIEEHKDDCIAIGECGLDYQVVPGTEDLQKKEFQKVIDLAKKINKPLIIHSRKAEKDVIEMLEKNNCKKVIMHCFMGRKSLMQKCIENKWCFSVPPIITRLQHFQTLVQMVPLTQLLTETDAPYLAPIQGERNEPANVLITIKEIAKIKNLSEKEVANQIWENAKTFFIS